jgi:hypothetical protein
MMDGGMMDGGMGTMDSGNPDGSVPTTTRAIDPPAISVAVGTESTQCVLLRAGNTSPELVRAMHYTSASGVLQFAVFRSTETTEVTTPMPCSSANNMSRANAAPLDRGLIYFGQSASSNFAFPLSDGSSGTAAGAPVGVLLPANAMLLIEIHALNSTGSALSIAPKLSFDTILPPANAVSADMLVTGTINISIGAFATADTGNLYQELGPGISLVGIETQQHSMGTGIQFYRGDSSTQVSSTPLASVSDWTAGAMMAVSPIAVFGTSTAGVRYHCQWNNTSASTRKYGFNSSDELCFAWGYYFPAAGFKVAVPTVAVPL